MAYLDWQYMAALVEGEKRLKDDIVRRGESAEVHPFFDQKAAEVDAMVDDALDDAGYATPLDEITDPVLKKAAAGILIGILTETSSSREAWMDGMHKAGLAYLEKIRSGELSVAGVETDTAADEGGSEVYGQFGDDPMFDGPNTGFAHAFPPLGPPRGWR